MEPIFQYLRGIFWQVSTSFSLCEVVLHWRDTKIGVMRMAMVCVIGHCTVNSLSMVVRISAGPRRSVVRQWLLLDHGSRR
jgi:hypothetical protein